MRKNENKLYEKIYSDIKKKVLDGSYKPGEKLPSVHEFCEIYHTSDATIRKSLELAKKNGLIFSINRVGIFVTESGRTKSILKFHELDNLKNKIDRIEVISSNVIESSDYFSLSKQEKYLRLERIFYSNGLPSLYVINYIPFRICSERFMNSKWTREFDYFIDSYYMKKAISIELCDDEQYRRKLYLDDSMGMFKIVKKFYTENGSLQGISEIYALEEELNIKIFSS